MTRDRHNGALQARRRELEALHLRALECSSAVSLGIGGAEVRTAVRSARRLVVHAPYRESGQRLLMQALATEGNFAEALLVYDRLRVLLHNDLGIAPGPDTQALHGELLARCT
jgi:DNA-binding SARP family transcriptional activator